MSMTLLGTTSVDYNTVLSQQAIRYWGISAASEFTGEDGVSAVVILYASSGVVHPSHVDDLAMGTALSSTEH